MQIYIKKLQFVVSDVLGWKSPRRENHDFTELPTVLWFLFPVDTCFIQSNFKIVETNTLICANFSAETSQQNRDSGEDPTSEKFMHKDNRPLKQFTYISQGWQTWECCSEKKEWTEQERRMGKLWQLCPVVPLPSSACAGTCWGQGFPLWLCLWGSSSPGAPVVQPNLLSAPHTFIPAVSGQLQQFALQ